jgi:hypothetical protein
MVYLLCYANQPMNMLNDLSQIFRVAQVVATDRGRGRRPHYGRGPRLPWFLMASLGLLDRRMADTGEGGSQETRPHPPRPRAASRPQLNRASTASSPAATPTSAAHSTGGAPSSSAATTPTSGAHSTGVGETPSPSAQAQPTATGVARTIEIGGMAYVVVDEDDDVPVAKRQRKLKSDVWLEFDQVTIVGRLKAKCHWCKKILVGGSNSGTNHLRGHLKICVSCQVRKGLQQATFKLGKNENMSVVVEKYVSDQQVARKELALMICVHEDPLSMVDHIGFRKFCAALQPLFKAVSRNTIKKIYWICMSCKGSLW